MTKQERNIRTLIVCFVVSMFGLMSLKFVEANNIMVSSKSQVLEDETVVEVEEVDDVDIVLPNAEIDLSDLNR
jgi:hypothetical protein